MDLLNYDFVNTTMPLKYAEQAEIISRFKVGVYQRYFRYVR